MSGRIEDYVREVAAFKAWVRGLDGDVSSIVGEIEEIGRYLREIAGRLRRRPIEALDVVVEHGDIVHALKLGRDRIASRGEQVFNTPLIDLYVRKNNRRTEVYEVKTALDRQSLYTAIGQLAVHGSSAQASRLLLVVPEGPIADDIRRAVTSMNIEVIRYATSASGYAFDPPLRRS